MVELLTAFGRAFEASAALALPAAFAWGVLSVALSPCHLSSIPLVVAYMSGGDELPTGRRAVVLAGSFAIGILASIAAVGAATAAAGRMVGDVGRGGTWALAAVFLAVGLNLIGILPLPTWSAPTGTPRQRGTGGALLLAGRSPPLRPHVRDVCLRCVASYVEHGAFESSPGGAPLGRLRRDLHHWRSARDF